MMIKIQKKATKTHPPSHCMALMHVKEPAVAPYATRIDAHNAVCPDRYRQTHATICVLTNWLQKTCAGTFGIVMINSGNRPNKPHASLRSAFALIAALTAVVAQALTVTPAGPLSATGTLHLSKGIISLTCTAKFNGSITPAGALAVEKVQFFGKNRLCKKIKPINLPWTGQMDSNTEIIIRGLHAEISAAILGGHCGPMDMMVAWNNDTSAVYFNKLTLPPGCTMEGMMVIEPAMQVDP